MTTNVVFLALARDCADTLPGFVDLIRALRRTGTSTTAVVGEDGSADATRELLTAASDVIDLVDTSSMQLVQGRLSRMAHGRDLLARQVPVGATGVVCVVDLDEPFFSTMAPEAFLAAVERVRSEAVFAVAATSRPTYYDLLAFEGLDAPYCYLEERIHALQGNPLAYYRLFRDVIYPEQQRLTSTSDIVCRSAFNGMCLYRAEDFVHGTYLSADLVTRVCEHVTFNRSLGKRTGQLMVIDGSLVLPMPVEHGVRSLPGFVLQRAGKGRRLLRVVMAAATRQG